MKPTEAGKPQTGSKFDGRKGGKPAAKPSARPMGKPVTKPEGRPGEKAFGKPSARPMGKPVAKSEGRPGDKAFGKPNARPMGKPVTKPEGRPGEKAFGKPSVRPFAKPVAKPEGRTGEKPFGKPSARPMGKPGPKPTVSGVQAFPSPQRSGGAKPSSFGRPTRPISRPGAVRPAPRSVPQEASGLSLGARRLALEVLRDVRQNGAFAQLSLNEKLSKSPLKPVDKRLVTSIVYGTLENQLRIDYALDKFMERPTQDPLQRDILRLSACQILFHDRVPDSAAVNEGVKLAKAMGMEASAGFFNAVLRNLSRGKAEIPWPKKEEGLEEYLHIMGSMPMWIVEKLIQAYGAQEAENVILYRETEHPVVVRPNRLRMTDEAFEALLAKKVWKARKGIAPHAYLVSGAAELAMDNDYRDGLFSIQGQSSMLAAEAVEAKPGMRVLDACAAPGGKSAYLCEAMQNTGRVFAWELHEKRAMLLESLKRRLNLENLRISVRDAAEPKPEMDETLDAVLLDAPCSGLGVMVQKPDLKYRLKPEDIGPIVETQRRLLETLCHYVKPQGVLVYSTCSILPEENKEQIEGFLGKHPEFELEALPISFPENLREQQTPLGLQLLGYRDGVEGFYIARLRKKKGCV